MNVLYKKKNSLSNLKLYSHEDEDVISAEKLTPAVIGVTQFLQKSLS